jgi:Lipid A 3-O-deacylase (PagL)
MMLTTLFPGMSSGQDLGLPTQLKGTEDAEVWIGGVAAQHDGTTSFNTEVWMGGIRLGRILTAAHGPGWLRGTLQWGIDAIPLFVVSNLQTAYGAEIDPIAFRWNFNHGSRSSPYFEMAGGLVITNSNIPPGHTSNLNVVPKIGFGWQIFRQAQRSIDVGVHAWHLSNAWTAPRNPSVNGIQLTIGYHWFKLKRRATANRNQRAESNAGS